MQVLDEGRPLLFGSGQMPPFRDEAILCRQVIHAERLQQNKMLVEGRENAPEIVALDPVALGDRANNGS